MRFGFLRLIDHLLGRALLYLLFPLCWLARATVPKPADETLRTFTFIKLHGGGSLLIAMPSLLGLRKKYPDEHFLLVCTGETQKYAELTGVFNDTVAVNSKSFIALVITGFQALAKCAMRDVCIDLEPHSTLAAVFTMLTLSRRRLGFVKSNETFRAEAYTEALFFNPFAPIFAFYDQLAGLLGAPPATVEECRASINASHGLQAMPVLPAGAKRPVLYLSPFCSDFAVERMMPNELWPRLLKRHYGNAAMTILIGGGKSETGAGDALKKVLDEEIPLATTINLTGTRSLHQCVEDVRAADAFWGIDSGPLHIARLLGKPCFSFWGPTNPAHRLRAMPALEEKTAYLGFACSPCIDSVERSPCNGNNLCMRLFLEPPAATPPVHIRPEI